MSVSSFKNWKARASGVGNILTQQVSITEKQLHRIEILAVEKETGKNFNGNNVKWTEKKSEELDKLIYLKNKPDSLPDGALTYLDGVFRHIFWGRRRSLKGSAIEKGTKVEVDSLALISKLDGAFYAENKKQYANDYLTGEPDNAQFNIKEIKSSFDLESFEKASLTNIYRWQAIAYCWLCNKKNSELIYCLVNNPINQLNKAIHWAKEKYPEQDVDINSKFIEEAQQIERNMIFDIEKWNKEFPSYDWYNKVFDFSIPKPLRVNRFKIDANKEHYDFIKSRVKMARKYLMEKEQIELEKIKSFSEEDYLNQIEIIKYKLDTKI